MVAFRRKRNLLIKNVSLFICNFHGLNRTTLTVVACIFPEKTKTDETIWKSTFIVTKKTTRYGNHA